MNVAQAAGWICQTGCNALGVRAIGVKRMEEFRPLIHLDIRA
jgi:hypothetical protein